jgi:hypothetical protein
MSDKIYKKLPGVLQTTAIKNFFESTVEQLFSKANVENIQGFIGNKTSDDVNVKGSYIPQPTVTRRFYNVTPTVNNIDPRTGKSENLVFYDEFIESLATYGVDVKNHNRIFGEKYNVFMPPIDADKLINYQEYYWYPDGPAPVEVRGTLAEPIDINRDIIGKAQFIPPVGKKLRSGMIIKFAGEYVIPASQLNVEYIVEGVGEKIYLVPKVDNFSTRFSTPVDDVYDATIFSLDDENVRHSAGNVSSVTVLNGGTGYSNTDIVTISGATSTPASANIVVDANGSVTTVVINSAGDLYSDQVRISIQSTTGKDFVGSVILDDMHTITSSTVDILSTQAKTGIDPNTGKYYFLGGTYSFDKDTDGDNEGNLQWGGGLSQSVPDYIVQRRGAANKNVWSRVNFWYHKNNFIDAGVAVPNEAYRAQRPIIEFDHRLELYNHGVRGIGAVNIACTTLSFAELDGSRTGALVDDVPVERATIIFPYEDVSISKYIYQAFTNIATNNIELMRVGDPELNPAGAEDGDLNFVPWEMLDGDVVQIKNGSFNIGKEFRFTGDGFVICQEKISVNQDPLFNLYDDAGVYLGDPGKYPSATFAGNRVFGYVRDLVDISKDVNITRSSVQDEVLGFHLYYRPFKASSEIAFITEINQKPYYYTPIGTNNSTLLEGYFFYKLLDNTEELHTDWKTISVPSTQRIYTSYTLDQFDIDNNSKTFFIGCEPKQDSNKNSGYDIEVKVNGIKRTDFTYGASRVAFIDFDAFNFTVGDFIEISAFSDNGLISYDSISKYEVPLSWRNPFNQPFDVLSEPEFLPQFKKFIEKQDGFEGDALSVNNFASTNRDPALATDIVQTDHSAILAAFLLDSQPHNLVEAIRFNSGEYQKYKNRLKSEINNYYNTYDISNFSNEYVLEQVLRNVTSFKVGKDVFNRTYVVPFGDNYIQDQFTVNDRTVSEFVSTTFADLNEIENSLLVYVQSGTTTRLLNVDADYTISSFNPITVEINRTSVTLDLGDVVTLKIYDSERDSAQCPPTPSILGLYQLYQPSVETDYSFKEPLDVVIGHDGSRTPVLGDRRDDILLEFEKRIYNAAKSQFRLANSLPELNRTSVKPGAFRGTGFEYKEWYDLMRYHFATWSTANKVDPVANEFFDAADPWTWNYRGNQDIGGYWKGWYDYYYDTFRPNTDPWEMLGFTEQPTWWNDQYGTDYGSNNTAMWDDLEEGIIRRGRRENFADDSYLVNNPFRRIGLHQVIPVDADGNLITPYELISTGSTTKTVEWRPGNANTSLGYATTSFLNTDGLNISFDASNVYVEGKALVNHSLSLHPNFVGHSEIEEQDVSYVIPRNTDQTPTAMPDYAVAVMVNGIAFYTPKSTKTWNDAGEWHYNNGNVDDFTEFTSYGHSTVNGLFHYHSTHPEVVGLTAWSKTTHSPIIGWAFDGLPIYGPYGYKDPLNPASEIVNIKSPFRLRSGVRQTGPGGAHTGMFVEDFDLDGAVLGQLGYTDQYNTRYGVTPDSPSTPIRYYVATVDDSGKPMFPYAVGGGVQSHSTSGSVWAGKYCAVPADISNNTTNSAVVPANVIAAITSDKIVEKSYTDAVSADWKFGDGAPVEISWRYSEDYPFAVVEALLLGKPAQFATLFADPTRIERTVANKDMLVETTSRGRWQWSNPGHFRVHGEIDNAGNFVTNIGYSQFINSWLNFQGLTINNSFAYKLRTLNVKLGHRFAGFIDKDTMTLRTDQYSTTGNATSLIVPSENVNVVIHSSPYKTRNFYSGVIIEKLEDGFKVRGFDRNFGYFLTLASRTSGPREKVSVGGEPANFVDWTPNISYRKSAIVRYQNSYYRAPSDIAGSATFDRSVWTRLSALPQIGAATGVLYQDTTGEVVRVDYETKFTTTDELFDFLISLGRYQKSIGFNFGEYDSSINATRDWAYAAKQFLFWVTGNWEIGNTLELSPMATNVTFSTELGFISKLNRVDRDQFVLMDSSGAVISPTECEIVREDNRIEIAPPTGRQIYSALIYTQEIEHAMTVDNITVFNDVIYDPLRNQKHTRFKLKGKRTANWDGRYITEGFVISGDELKPNLDNLAGTIGRYNELGFVPVDKQLYQVARAQYGYQDKEYLRELDITDDQQVDFYLGMLQSKGTSTSLGRIARSNAIVQGNVTVYDEWALRVGDFGDTENDQSVELKLNKSEFINDPQLITLAFPEDTTNIVEKIEVLDRKHKYYSVPQIIISAPTSSNGVRATAEATLNSAGELSSISVTNTGSGYGTNPDQPIVGVTVIAGSVVVDTVDTKFNAVTALSSNSWISTSGLSNVVINDHLSANGNVVVNLSSATDADDIVTLINSAPGLGGNITATVYRTDTDISGNSDVDIGYTLALTGNDFSIVSAAAGLYLTTGRYQPRQRYAIETANNTVAANVSVRVDDNLVSSSFWALDSGDRWTITTVSAADENQSLALNLNTGTENGTSAMAAENTILTDGEYPFVDVFVNGVKINNKPDQQVFTLTTTSITFSNVSLLPQSALTPAFDYSRTPARTKYILPAQSTVKIIEKATIDFTDAYQGDVPGSQLEITVQTNDAIAIKLGTKRIYEITPDAKDDDVILIDIDDTTRFLKKPLGVREHSLWPTTSGVDYSGIIDSKYPTLPNAGYVNPANVNFMSYDVASLPDLFDENIIIKPSGNSYIHVAASENNDWNVYKLQQAGGVTYLANLGDDAKLYTTESLFNYIDSNQIGENDTSRYLDFFLTLKNANVSDNVVVWTNETIIKQNELNILDVEAPRMIEARIKSIGPHPTARIAITNITPVSTYSYKNASMSAADANNIVTISNVSIPTLAEGDAVSFNDATGNTYSYSANLTYNGVGNVTVGASNVAYVTASGHVTLAFSGDPTANNKQYYVESVNVVGNSFVVRSDYFANANVVAALSNINYSVTAFEDFGDSNTYFTVSNVTPLSFTIERPASVARNVDVYHMTLSKLFTANAHGISSGDVIRVATTTFSGAYSVRSVPTSNSLIIAAPFVDSDTFSGNIITRGIQISTIANHGIQPIYARKKKRIAVHFAEPRQYNQTYFIDSITPDTINILGRYPVDDETYYFYDEKFGYANADSNVITVDASMNLNDVTVMYMSNSFLVAKNMYTVEANGDVKFNNNILNEDANVSTGFIIAREPENVFNGRYPLLTTIDHNRVKLNNSEIQIDSFNNLGGLATSINRAINLRRSAIVADGDQRVFKMGFNFLNNPGTPVAVNETSTLKIPAGAINNYGPYVKDEQVINNILGSNVKIVGKIPLSTNVEKIKDDRFNKGPIPKGPTYGFTYERDGQLYVWNPLIEDYTKYDVYTTEGDDTLDTDGANTTDGGSSDGTDSDTGVNPDGDTDDLNTTQPPALPQGHDPSKPKLRIIPGSVTADPIVTTTMGVKWRGYIMKNANGTDYTRTFTGVPGMGSYTGPRWRLKTSGEFLYEVYELVQNSAGKVYYILVDRLYPPAVPHDFFGTVNAYNDFDGLALENLYYSAKITPYDPAQFDIASANPNKYTITIPPVEPAWYVGKQLIPEPFARSTGNGSDAEINFANLPQPMMIGALDVFNESETRIQVNGNGMNSFLLWTPGLTPGEWTPNTKGPGSLLGANDTPTYWGFGRGYYYLNDGHRPTSDRSPATTSGPYPGKSTNGWVTRQQRFKYSSDFTVSPIIDTRTDNFAEKIVSVSDYDNPAITGLRPEEVFVACFWTEAHTYVNQLVGYDYKNVDSNGNPTPLYRDYEGTVTRVKYIRLTELPFDAVLRRPIPDTGWGGKGWKNTTTDRTLLPTDPQFDVMNGTDPWAAFDPTTPSTGGSTGDDDEPTGGTSTTVPTGTTANPGLGRGFGRGFDPQNIPSVDDVPAVGGEGNNNPPAPIIHGGALAGLPTQCEIDESNIPVPEVNTDPTNIPCFLRDSEDVLALETEKNKDAKSTLASQVNETFVYKIVGNKPFMVFFDFSSAGTLANGLTIEQAEDEAFTKGVKVVIDTSSTGTNKNVDDGEQIGVYGIDIVPGVGRSFVPAVNEAWYVDTEQVYANPLTYNADTINLAKGPANNPVGVKGYGFISRRIDCRDGEFVRVTVHKGAGNTVGTYRLAISFTKRYERVIEPPPPPGCDNATRGSRRFKDGVILDKYVFSDAKKKNNKFLGMSFGGLFGKKSVGRFDGYFGNGAGGPLRNQGDNIYYPYQAHPTYKNKKEYIAKTADPNSSEANGGLEETTQSKTIDVSSVPEYSTYEFKGYYKASASGTHTFKTTSDDGSWLWVSDVDDTLPLQEKYKQDGHRPDDQRNYNWTNAIVANGGLHGAASTQGTVSLEAGKYYFVRGIFGNNKKAGSFKLEVQPPGTSSFVPVEFTGRLCPGDPGYVDPNASTGSTGTGTTGTGTTDTGTPGTPGGGGGGGGGGIDTPLFSSFSEYPSSQSFGIPAGGFSGATGRDIATGTSSLVTAGMLDSSATLQGVQTSGFTSLSGLSAETSRMLTGGDGSAGGITGFVGGVGSSIGNFAGDVFGTVTGAIGDVANVVTGGLKSIWEAVFGGNTKKNFSGYSSPSLTGYNFMPTTFKAIDSKIRVVSPQRYGFAIPLRSDRYVNATSQRVTGGFVVPLAKKLDVVSRVPRPLNSVNIQNEPWFRSIGASLDRTMRGVTYQPTKISSTYYLPDGSTAIRNVVQTPATNGRTGYDVNGTRTLINRVAGTSTSEQQLGGIIPGQRGLDTVTLTPDNGPGVDFVPGVGVPPGGGGSGGTGGGGQPPINYDNLGPSVPVPWEYLPVDDNNIDFAVVPTINITPLGLDDTGAYVRAGQPAVAPIARPTPSATISDEDLLGVADNSEIFINNKKIILRPGKSIKDVAAQINCANMGVKALIDTATNQLKINSCTDAGFAIKNGCAGGRYKQVADFHIVRGFEQQKNTSQTISNSDVGSIVSTPYNSTDEIYTPQTYSRYYKNDDGDLINLNDDVTVGTTSTAGAFIPSQNISNTTTTVYATGGKGYRIGDRLRIVGGTPVNSTIGPLTTICIDEPGIGYTNPANLKIIIGDGASPGIGASAIVTQLDANGGVGEIQMLNYGVGYDISEPPPIKIVDTGAQATQSYVTLDAANPSGTYNRNTILLAQISRELPGGLIELDEKFFRVTASNVTLGNVYTDSATLTVSPANTSGEVTITTSPSIIALAQQPGYVTVLCDTTNNTANLLNDKVFLITSINTTTNRMTIKDAFFANANTSFASNISSLSNVEVSVIEPFTSRGMTEVIDPRISKVEAVLSAKVALSPDFVKTGNPTTSVANAFVEGFTSAAGPVRVAKFVVTGVDGEGAITSLKIIDRGLYKIFPSDLTMGIPLEYDFEYLGNSPLPDNILGYADPIRNNTQYGVGHPLYGTPEKTVSPFVGGKHPDWNGFKEVRFDTKTRSFVEYQGTPGGYDPLTYVEIGGQRLSKQYSIDLNPLSPDYGNYVDPLELGGGTGARVFVTSQDVPDCSEKSTAREDMGLPELVSDVSVPDALATMLNNALTGAGYQPDDIRFEVDPLGPGVGRLNLVSPKFPGVNIDTNNPGFLDKLGIPVGDYNTGMLCIQATISTPNPTEAEIDSTISKLYDTGAFGALTLDQQAEVVGSQGAIEPPQVLSLLCVNTIEEWGWPGTPPKVVPGTNINGGKEPEENIKTYITDDVVDPENGIPGTVTEDNSANNKFVDLTGALENNNSDLIPNDGRFSESGTGDIGNLLFTGEVYRYDLQTIFGGRVTLNGSKQYNNTFVFQSQRFDNEAQLLNPVTGSLDLVDFPKVWVDNYNNNGWAFFDNANAVPVRVQEPLVDVEYVKNSLVYDSEYGDKEFDLHFWDPFKGVLPGFIRNEIHFITEQDPVSYNNARTNFGRNNIGKVWWDTGTLRYMWYEQGSNRERWLNWGRTFPGSTVTVCEWVESKVLPQNWTGDGTPRWVDRYVTERHWNEAEQKYEQYFYYWVQNRSKLDERLSNTGRKLDILTVARYIANPVGYGINLINFVSSNAFVLSNVASNLREDESIIQINLSRNLNPEGMKHTAWKLMREGDNNSTVPDHLTDKLIDSVCAENAIGQVVPDPLLSQVERYGIAFRPRQAMFKDIKEARRVLRSIVNEILADTQLESNYSGWDNNMPSTLNYVERVTWYAVERIDLATNEKIRYNSSYKPVFNIASVSELEIYKNVNDGTVVQVNDPTGSRHQLWMYVAADDEYKLIAIKNETVRLSDRFYVEDTTTQLSAELRAFLTALVDTVFVNNENWNTVFFEMLKYAYAEQHQLSWAFKTSYIYIEKEEEDLIPSVGFKPDNFAKVIEYMNEVKPYTAKIREYKDGKRAPIEYIGQNSISDFDKPPYADRATNTIRILDDFDADDATIMANDPRYTNYYSVTNKTQLPFRHNNTKLVFDRTNWQLTQFGFNANTTTYNQSIAWNMANINSLSNTQVSSNSYIRSADRIFKFDPVVRTAFVAEVNAYYGNNTAGADSNVITNSSAIYNMLEAGALSTTLFLVKEKVGGGFRGETLDANVFTKFVEGFDSTTDLLTNFGYDTDPWDTVGWDQNIEVVNYEGIFNEATQGNITLRRNDTTYEGFDGATFKKILYGEERPEELALLDPLESLIMRVTTSIYPIGNSNTVIASTPINSTASNVTFQIHQNLFGNTEYLRVLEDNRTILAANAYSYSTEITVVDAGVLPDPKPGLPGIIWIGSERVLYERKIGNTLSLLTRGSAGTTAQDWLITDLAGNSVDIEVWNGAETETFDHLNPSSNVWLEIGVRYDEPTPYDSIAWDSAGWDEAAISGQTAISITDKANADYANVTSLMKFIHNI